MSASGRDSTRDLQERLARASANRQLLRIRGGGTKDFYGRPHEPEAAILDTSVHQGILDYEPAELVIRVRSGTLLSEVQALLAQNNQMLAFEPPNYGSESTIGGVVAAGLSGPARPYRGGVRDHVLGVTMASGDGRIMAFGGQVMKNVAGFDVSRLVAGSNGILGLILDISLKVVPVPEKEVSMARSVSASSALEHLMHLQSEQSVLSASAWYQDRIYFRFSGAESAVRVARSRAEGDDVDPDFWHKLAVQQLEGMPSEKGLWKLSLAASNPEFVKESLLIDWGGAVRWFSEPPEVPAEKNFLLYRFRDDKEQGREGERFPPLQPAVKAIHSRLKHCFDPERIVNRGRMYSWL